MAKKSKLPQTDWTRQGKDIADTAVPYWKNNLTQLNDYMQNVQNRYDPYLEYANLGQAASQSDFLREYNKAMADQTGQNYAATGGGYSSLGQRNYDQQQRYYNDLAARMYQQGLDWADNQAAQEFSMLTQAPQVWQNAYNQGANYSKIDQYNQLVDDANSNWWSAPMNVLGDIGLASGNPWGMAIGGALKLGAGLTSSDAGNLADSLLNQNNREWNRYQDQQMSKAGLGAFEGLQKEFNWGGGNNANQVNAPTTSSNFGSYSPSYGLGATDTSDWKFSWQR